MHIHSGAGVLAKNIYNYYKLCKPASEYACRPKICHLLYSARKTDGPVATACVGVIAYKMSDGNTLGVLLSVPFATCTSTGEMQKSIKENEKLIMICIRIYGEPFKGDNSWRQKTLLGGIQMSGYSYGYEIYIKIP